MRSSLIAALMGPQNPGRTEWLCSDHSRTIKAIKLLQVYY